jgi:glycosyltransferase involved in cell wall biosynthesis
MITQISYPERFQLLKRTLASLRARTQYPFELVVVDNGPAKQIEWLMSQDIDTHIINKVNQGMGRARNQGAGASTAKYLAFIDNDLVFFDNWLTESIALLEEYEEKDIILAPMKTIPMKRECYRVGQLDGHSLWKRAGSGALVFRRRDWERIGPFSEQAESGKEYGQRATAKGYVYLLLKQPKIRHVGRTRTWPRLSECVNGQWLSKAERQLQESKKCQSN